MNWSSKTWGVHWHCSSFGRRNSCLSDEFCSPFGPTISWAERLRLCVGHLPKPAASMKRIPSQYCETMPDCFLGECFTKSLSLFQRLNMSKPFRPWIWPFLQETLYEPLHTNETDYGPTVESFFCLKDWLLAFVSAASWMMWLLWFPSVLSFSAPVIALLLFSSYYFFAFYSFCFFSVVSRVSVALTFLASI